MTPDDSMSLALRLAGVLEKMSIRYILGGSLASTAFGEPRSTLDIDLACELTPVQLGPLLQQLGDDFLADVEGSQAEVAANRSFQILHLPSMTRIDVFVPHWRDFDEWKWQQRRRLSPAGSTQGIDVTSPEGIVLQKLRWFRAGGEVSDRQWRDLVGVLKAQRQGLDHTSLRHWAGRLGVADLLARALLAAGLST